MSSAPRCAKLHAEIVALRKQLNYADLELRGMCATRKEKIDSDTYAELQYGRRCEIMERSAEVMALRAEVSTLREESRGLEIALRDERVDGDVLAAELEAERSENVKLLDEVDGLKDDLLLCGKAAADREAAYINADVRANGLALLLGRSEAVSKRRRSDALIQDDAAPSCGKRRRAAPASLFGVTTYLHATAAADGAPVLRTVDVAHPRTPEAVRVVERVRGDGTIGTLYELASSTGTAVYHSRRQLGRALQAAAALTQR